MYMQCTYLYVVQGHEVYRAWVALRDVESGKEAGVQGFLKLSVTVLGPEDRQRVHDLAEEIQVGAQDPPGAGRDPDPIRSFPGVVGKNKGALWVLLKFRLERVCW